MNIVSCCSRRPQLWLSDELEVGEIKQQINKPVKGCIQGVMAACQQPQPPLTLAGHLTSSKTNQPVHLRLGMLCICQKLLPPKEVGTRWSAGSEAKRHADLHQSHSWGRREIVAHVAVGWRSVLNCVGGVATQRRDSCGIWSLFEMISVIQEEATQSCCGDMTALSTRPSPHKGEQGSPKVHISSPAGKYVQTSHVEKQIPTQRGRRRWEPANEK